MQYFWDDAVNNYKTSYEHSTYLCRNFLKTVVLPGVLFTSTTASAALCLDSTFKRSLAYYYFLMCVRVCCCSCDIYLLSVLN